MGERRFPVMRTGRTIPWPVAQRAYEAYAKLYGTSQSLERLADRGGFHPDELDRLLPGWRTQADAADTEVTRLRKERKP
jgi:hypothetical protein